MPPPRGYATFLLIIGLAGAAGGVEGEQKIAIIFILLFARLQLRLQLRCIHREAVENFYDFFLYLHRRNRNKEFSYIFTMHMRNTRAFLCRMNFCLIILQIMKNILWQKFFYRVH